MIGLLISLAVAAQIAPGQAAASTCEVRGRITDRDTGAPVPRAIVSIISLTNPTDGLTSVADDDGRYELVGLRPGQYVLYAEGASNRATHLRSPFVGPGGERRITLKDGEMRADINVALAHAAALSVRVTDEWGEPLSGVRILLLAAATRSEVPVGFSRATDDRGIVRLFPLEPGGYFVCAEPQQGPYGTGRGPESRERFVKTCLSSAADGGAELPVVLKDGGTEDVELRLNRRRTYSISGTVVDTSGNPAPSAMVSLDRHTARSSSGTGVRVDATGRFAIRNIPPGDYAMRAEVGGPNRPRDRRPLEAAYLPVHVDGSDIDELTIAMTRAATVRGRVTLEEASIPFTTVAPLLIAARLAADPLPGSGSTLSTAVSPDRTFALDGLFGRRAIAIANVPRGWCVKTIRYGAKDITDVPTDFKSGDDSLEIILSTRGASISGSAVDAAGNPGSGVRVIVFPADSGRWWMREIPSVTAAKDGSFTLGPLRAGDYLVAAITTSSDAFMGSPEEIAALAPLAERVTLREEETVRVTLPVKRR